MRPRYRDKTTDKCGPLWRERAVQAASYSARVLQLLAFKFADHDDNLNQQLALLGTRYLVDAADACNRHFFLHLFSLKSAPKRLAISPVKSALVLRLALLYHVYHPPSFPVDRCRSPRSFLLLSRPVTLQLADDALSTTSPGNWHLAVYFSVVVVVGAAVAVVLQLSSELAVLSNIIHFQKIPPASAAPTEKLQTYRTLFWVHQLLRLSREDEVRHRRRVGTGQPAHEVLKKSKNRSKNQNAFPRLGTPHLPHPHP